MAFFSKSKKEEIERKEHGARTTNLREFKSEKEQREFEDFKAVYRKNI
jgi:hypothetical protein